MKCSFIFRCRSYQPDVVVALQTIQLRDWFRVRQSDVPDFDATLTAGINVLGRIRDRYRADYFAVIESVNLTRVARYAWADESILRERRRLHLTVEDMVAIRAAK